MISFATREPGGIRVVVDTNVAISAALLPGVSHQALMWITENARLLMSFELASEWLAVLRRPKFRRYISEEDAEEFVRGLLTIAEWVTPVTRVHACRDAKDNMVLELADAGRADVIVSGDQDLLRLHTFQGIPVQAPRDFLRHPDQPMETGSTPTSE